MHYLLLHTQNSCILCLIESIVILTCTLCAIFKVFLSSKCPIFCISQQWSQSAQSCNCLTPSSTRPLMKQPNHKQSFDGVEAGPSTETGCGSETSWGCSSTLWFKLSERARIPFSNCHFNSKPLSLMLPLAGSVPSRLPVAGYQGVITAI